MFCTNTGVSARGLLLENDNMTAQVHKPQGCEALTSPKLSPCCMGRHAPSHGGHTVVPSSRSAAKAASRCGASAAAAAPPWPAAAPLMAPSPLDPGPAAVAGLG